MRFKIGVFAVALLFIGATSISNPNSVATPEQTVEALPAQKLTVVASPVENVIVRDSYTVIPKPKPPPPPKPKHVAPNITPNPGSAQAYAQQAVAARGWGTGEFNCLVALWNKESGWRVNAMNPSSGAYGIPQSLPGNKMASAGADWETNPATQINWGLNYIQNRYSTPCSAFGKSQSQGWY